MTSVCLVRFADESLGRIVATNLIRLQDKKKFAPKAARDLPDSAVRVKWQKSVDGDGSFSSGYHDGYFDAEVLAIAGSVKTARAKAVEMKLRLHPSPLLALPSSSEPETTRRRKQDRLRAKVDEEKAGESKEEPKGRLRGKMDEEKAGESKEEPKGRPRGKMDEEKAGESKEEPKGKDKRAVKRTIMVDAGGAPKKRKRIKIDDVSLNRTAAVAASALANNPLFQEKDSDLQDAKTPSGCGEDKSLDKSQLKCEDKPSKADTDVKFPSSDEEDDDAIFLPNGFEYKPDKGGNDEFSHNVSGTEEKEEKSEELPPSVQNADRSNSPRSETTVKVDASSSGESSDESVSNSDALDDKMKDLDEVSSDESTKCDSSSEDSEDEVSKLSASNEELKTSLKSLKESSAECKRNLTLANNIRIAYKNEIKELKDALQAKDMEVQLLMRRNATLQDMLCQKYSGSPPSEKNVKEETKVREKEMKVKEEEKKVKEKGMKMKEEDKRVKGKEKKGKEEEKKSEKVKKEQPSMSDWDVMSDDDCLISSTPKKSSLNDSSHQTMTSTPPKNLCSKGVDSDKGKKKGKGGKEDLKNPDINLVCERILRHLRAEDPLIPDPRGFVDLGLNVLVDMEALEKNLADHKGDVHKISKSLAALTWTSSQREQRSLEGGKNNRFPNAPAKKAATPKKVNACLGVVKAHLLHQGDVDGPGMAQNLKTSRKAIGAKFAQDYAQAKKRAQQE